MKTVMFNCLRCGRQTEQSKHGNRKYCPECAKIMHQERSKAASIKLNKEIVESNIIKNACKQTDERDADLLKAQLARDAAIDARSRAYIKKQCRFCKYRLLSGRITIGCDYIAWKGHSTDKGNGPGDCRSFEPITRESNAERTARRKRALRISEANNAQNTGEKMRDVNQL